MNIQSLVARAAQNNARWCDAMCRAHRVPGAFREAYWINGGKVPPYTSKLITLADSQYAAQQRTAIESLIASDEPFFSVKDAFQCLNLATLGFRALFHATWIAWEPGTTRPPDPAEQLEWSVVEDVDGLSAWESAWRGSPANAGVRGRPSVFLPSMLEEPGVRFLAGMRDGIIVATAALNRTGEVVGLSNVFSGAEDAGPLFPGCVRLAQQLHPGVAIVGYERGEDLLAAERAGCSKLHDLTVWEHSPSG